MTRPARIVSILLAAAALAAIAAAPAPGYGLEGLELSFEEQDGSPATQAGSHPYAVTTRLAIETETIAGEEGGEAVALELPTGETRDLTVALPPGFVGDSTAVPRCSGAEFATIDKVASQPACSSDSALGVVGIRGGLSPINPAKPEEAPGTYKYAPVYNLVPPPGVAAQFGFLVFNVPVVVDVVLSDSAPYRLVAKLHNISQFVLFYESELTIWGNPAAAVHDPYRGQCLDAIFSVGELISLGKCAVSVGEAKPFLTLPRRCHGPLTTSFGAVSWDGQSTGAQASTPGMSGCGNLSFAPDLALRPSTSAAESPTGLDADLEVSDEGLVSPLGTARSDIREISVALPEGMTANPSAAEGLGVCTPGQFAAADLAGDGCPEAAKLGSVEAGTPLLEEQLSGSLYLAQPDDPGTGAAGAENPFDSLLAVYLVIRQAQRGILVTQAGEIDTDAASGRILATFPEMPEVPLGEVGVRFREGPRAPLVTPPLCGDYASRAELSPWAGGAAQSSSSSFALRSGPEGGPCPPGGTPPFAPGFEAGTLNNAAGLYSPLYMRLSRRDGEQDLTRFDATLPPGVLGRIAGLERCPDAAIAAAAAKRGREELAAPSCPASSQVGRVLAGAGVGPALTYVPGSLYLAGPHGGDPLSVVAIVPAVAGPFDVGTVVVRQALDLDPRSAQVRVDGAASTPLPHILEGIPLKVRDIRVYAERPQFTLNATSCEESQTAAQIFGSGQDVFSAADDSSLATQSRYQAAGCQGLGFKPRLAIGLKGGARRGAFPALRAVVRPHPGEANFSRAVVTLPRSAFLEQGHIRTICTRVQFAAGAGGGAACPRASIYGYARAWSPLLEGPAEGPVFLRSSDNNLPDLVVALTGPDSAPVEVELSARIDSVKGGIRSTFTGIPDVPVSRFVLNMQGGKKGLIVNSRNLCRKAKRNRARARLVGQNGRRRTLRPVVRSSACAKKRGRRHRAHRARVN